MTPFFTRKPALSKHDFIGRVSDLRWIANKLNSASPQNINIVGEPRIGKTSLLHQAYTAQQTGESRSHIVPVWIAASEFAQPDSKQFWMALLQALQEAAGLPSVNLESEMDSAMLFNTLVTQIEKIIEQGSEWRVYFFIDDVDLLAPPVLGTDDLNWLRALTQRDRLLAHVAFIIASTDSLQKLTRSAQEFSPFHNVFVQRNLGLMQPSEAEALLQAAWRAAGQSDVLGNSDIAFLMDEAGRHPDLLRIIVEYYFLQIENGDGNLFDLVKANFRYDDHVQWLFQTLFNRRTTEERDALLAVAQKKSAGDVVLLNHLTYRLGLLEKTTSGEFRPFSAAFGDWLLRQEVESALTPQVTRQISGKGKSVPILYYDEALRRVQFDNRPTPIQLTRVENRLMAYLIENVGVVCSQEDILTNVWGPGRNKAVVEKTINRLRSKIEQDPSRPQYIISVWGQGYILENAAKLP